MKKRIPIPRVRMNEAKHSEAELKIEDYFDIDSLTKSDIISIWNDIRAFIPHTYDYPLSEDGDILIKESAYVTLPVQQVRVELKKLGFQDWQIKSVVRANKVRIIILYADLEKNTETIVNKMLTCGWSKARISEPQMKYGLALRVMDFDPMEQDPLTKEAHRHKYLYHLTPYKNVETIQQHGIEARSENDYLSYPPKAHIIKGNVSEEIISKLGWLLYSRNKKLNDGRYALFRIETSKVPQSIEFYGDPRFEYGYFTRESIPSSAIELYAWIAYKDKYNYRNETLNLFNQNDNTLSV